MRREDEAHWQCSNRACGKTAPARGPDCAAETRACVCGSPMKKQLQSRVFSYLNFLREEPSSECEERLEKESKPCER